MRFVELRVTSVSGRSATSQWMLAGSNGEPAAPSGGPRPSERFRGTAAGSSKRGGSTAWADDYPTANGAAFMREAEPSLAGAGDDIL